MTKFFNILFCILFAGSVSAHDLISSATSQPSGATTNIPVTIVDQTTGVKKVYNNKVSSSNVKRFAATAPTTVSGTLIVVHVDNFEAAKSADYAAILPPTKSALAPTKIDLATLPEMLKPGQQISVTGTSAAASTIIPSKITITVAPHRFAALAPQTKTLLVIPVKSSTTVGEPWAKSYDDSMYAQVAAWYNQMSYGMVTINVTVAPWASTTKGASCNYGGIGTDAEASAVANGFVIANYTNVLYHMNAEFGCGWLGLAYVGYGRAWINGPAPFIQGASVHELGHNFGLLHAGSLSCAVSNVNWDVTQCGPAEYGDYWSGMGNHGPWNFNAPQKLQISLIDATSVKTYTSGTDTNKTFSISTLSLPLPPGGTYAVKILTPSGKRAYWLEYRTADSVDAGNPAGIPKPAQLRVGSPLEVSAGSDDTMTLTALAVGETFTDTPNNIQIKINSVTPTLLNATVSIVTNLLPTTNVTSPVAGASIVFGQSFIVSATAADADGTISKVEFFINDTLINTSTSAPYTFNWTPPASGNYAIKSVATDNKGASIPSTIINVVVTPPAPTGTTIVLQRGLNGYDGIADNYIDKHNQTFNHGSDTVVNLDVPDHVPLVRFAIFQSEGGPIPNGSTINTATLSLYKQYYDYRLRLSPLLRPWVEKQSTWTIPQTGSSWTTPGAFGAGTDYDASFGPDVIPGWNPGWVDFDVTPDVKKFDGIMINYGWKLNQVGPPGNYLQFFSSEYLVDTTLRPKLTISYTPPVTNTPPTPPLNLRVQ